MKPKMSRLENRLWHETLMKYKTKRLYMVRNITKLRLNQTRLGL